MHDTLYVPDLRTYFLSVSKMTDYGHEVMFKKGAAYAVDSSGQIVAFSERQGDFYFVQEIAESTSLAEIPQTTLRMWHERMGHMNEASLKMMAKSKRVSGMSIPKNAVLGTCEICIKGKQSQSPYSHSERRKGKSGGTKGRRY